MKSPTQRQLLKYNQRTVRMQWKRCCLSERVPALKRASSWEEFLCEVFGSLPASSVRDPNRFVEDFSKDFLLVPFFFPLFFGIPTSDILVKFTPFCYIFQQ